MKNENVRNRGKQNHLRFLLGLTVVVVITTMLAVAGSSMHEPGKDRISVDDARPVARAAETLEQKYGWVVTYEDPRYAHESDLVDVTEKVRKDLDEYKPGQAPKLFVPKGGQLDFEYDVDPLTKTPVSAHLVVQQ